MFKRYYTLTKPGIIRGNLLPTVGGFFLASQGVVNIPLFLGTIIGTIFVIASGCVFNNYIDREIDSKMERTKNRSLVTGKISNFNALLFGAILGIISFAIFFLTTNILTTAVALMGWIFYVVFYSYFKRRTIHGTLIGGVSGAIPPVIGYVAVTQKIDMGALLLFLILLSWQMPHFYAIGIYRIADYKAAGLPIFSIVKGVNYAKIHMIFYVTLFTISVSLLTLFGLTGYIYLVIMLVLGLIWFVLGVTGFWSKNDNRWAKKMFSYSLIILLIFSVLISIDFYLPF